MTMPANLSPALGTYELDPEGCVVEFETRHLFGLASVRGGFREVTGEIDVRSPLANSQVHASVSVAGLDSGNSKRDEYVRSSRFLNEAAHPHISLRSTALTQRGSTLTLLGLLTAGGIEAPVTFHVSDLSEDEDVITFRATGTVDRFDHGINRMRFVAGRHLRISLTIGARRT